MFDTALSSTRFIGESEPKVDKCNEQSNKTCDVCIKMDGCSFCEKTKECMTFDTVKSIIHKTCEDQDWKYKQCILSGKVLIIALPVAGFVVLVALGCCIYCCCCRKKKKRGPGKEEAKWRRQREEIEIKHSERREERQKKHDEIRKKYGLYRKDADSEEPEDGRYHRFENAAVA
ncbi:negative regulation of DNA damage response, signal transduction by p53 class mediator [Desmophyllum pertusum]|uniref:Negative regulation of DNA damage response, signal transduction by p53 class mediator n=1 Tax=Desmophyllum pertusum TaxID=174260 RepID=A0A9W9Z6J9_9CNID|nr:negative regulation of DNA damage response, signal transduction by p53 class mediator [Desmophyllum pertusum]